MSTSVHGGCPKRLTKLGSQCVCCSDPPQPLVPLQQLQHSTWLSWSLTACITRLHGETVHRTLQSPDSVYGHIDVSNILTGWLILTVHHFYCPCIDLLLRLTTLTWLSLTACPLGFLHPLIDWLTDWLAGTDGRVVWLWLAFSSAAHIVRGWGDSGYRLNTHFNYFFLLLK